MRILIVSDAWFPQVNGVVRTLSYIRDHLLEQGHRVKVIGPSGVTMGCPTYPEIRLTLNPHKVLIDCLKRYGLPDAIHIATEGPLGHAMRRICLKKNWKFTTSFHTRFPEYLKTRFFLPQHVSYYYLRLFHQAAETTLVPTQSLAEELSEYRFANLKVWSRGVNTELFHPNKRQALPWPKPISLYVGRLAVEKNLEAFLQQDLPGTKLVVGDGPLRGFLQSRYPNCVFLGEKFADELAQIYASADVFVFPSRTDTFGLVMLEALASGTPVAAFPVTGPIDVLHPQVGILSENLGTAIRQALHLKRENCFQFAQKHSWSECANQFLQTLVERRAMQSKRSWCELTP